MLSNNNNASLMAKFILMMFTALPLIFFSKADMKAFGSPDIITLDIIAKVGEVLVYRSDFQYRMETYAKCYDSPVRKDTADIIAELVLEGIEETVLKKVYHTVLTDSMIVSRAVYIDSKAQNTAILEKIKSIYGSDSQSYYRNIVVPSLTHTILDDFFSSDISKQKIERDSIENLWRQIEKTPPAYFNMYPQWDTLYFNKTNTRQSTANQEKTNLNGSDPIVDKIMKKLTPGGLWHSIIEDNNRYIILTLIGKNDTSYISGAFIVKKQTLIGWIKLNFADFVEIKVTDKNFFKATLRKYPKIWWEKVVK